MPEQLPPWFVPKGELNPVNRSLRDKLIVDPLTDVLGGNRAARGAAEDLTGILDFLPGAGDITGALDTHGLYESGHPVLGTLSGAATAVGVVPAFKPVAKAARTALKGAAKGATAVPPPATVNMPAGSKPEYLGAAPDRSLMTHLRYRPKGGASRRVQASLEALSDRANPIRQEMINDIQRGIQLGGADWYNTEELRDWFVYYLGEEAGDAEWRGFMDLMGAASPGSKVDSNIGNASAIRQRLATDPAYVSALEQSNTLKEAQRLAKGRPKGYGHKTGGLQEHIVAKQVQGGWSGMPEPDISPGKGSWVVNPKPKGFSGSLVGNPINIAADLHFTRYMAMASKDPAWLDSSTDVSVEFMEDILSKYPKAKKFFKMRKINDKYVPAFNPKKAHRAGVVPLEAMADYPAVWAPRPNNNEYAAFEDFMGELGDELGLTAAQTQAALWMGAADRTGVDPTSQGTFMDLLRRRADKRAAQDGLSREEVIRRFILDKGLLSLPAAGIGLGMLGRGGEEEEIL